MKNEQGENKINWVVHESIGCEIFSYTINEDETIGNTKTIAKGELKDGMSVLVPGLASGFYKMTVYKNEYGKYYCADEAGYSYGYIRF